MNNKLNDLQDLVTRETLHSIKLNDGIHVLEFKPRAMTITVTVRGPELEIHSGDIWNDPDKLEEAIDNASDNDITIKTNLKKDDLALLRNEIVLNSLYVADYANSLSIPPLMLVGFFDGYLEYLEIIMQEKMGEKYVPDNFFEYLSEYDTLDELVNYYEAVGDDLYT